MRLWALASMTARHPCLESGMTATDTPRWKLPSSFICSTIIQVSSTLETRFFAMLLTAFVQQKR
jgi:hypothetical protein